MTVFSDSLAGPMLRWIATVTMIGAGAAIAHAQIVDTRIPLNYNFHGMSHSAFITGGTDEWTVIADNILADRPDAVRAIADRSIIFDALNSHSLAAYDGASLGATGLVYSFFNTLGYANTTHPDAAANGLDLVHLGSRCAGFPPASNAAYETDINTATNTGIAPAWNVCDHTGPQTTTFSPIALDAAAEIGVLYHASNSGGQFDVVLGFSDHPSITVRVAAPDWFGVPVDPAILANQPVSSQRKLAHRVGTTAYNSFQGADNRDAPVIRTFVEGGAGPNLNVMEAVISIPRMIAGVGTFPPTPTVAGAHLTSLAFQNATYPATGGRGYAVFAVTVRTGQPERANCNTPQAVGSGATATDNRHTFGATPTSCGGDDTTAVYYSYTAMTTGPIEALTCGAAFNTTLAVYDACGGDQLACNDDYCGTASRVEWNASMGLSYIIRVAGRAGATGAFTLTINDPAPTYLSLPLAYNWNGLVHGTAEQGAANRDNPDGYRSVADRGLLLLSGAANGIDTNPLRDADLMPYSLVLQAGALDIVHLGDRRTVANAARNWGSAANNGLQPNWLPDNDHTVPQVSDLSSARLVWTPTSRLGVIYQVSDSGGRFTVRINFTNNTSAEATCVGPDWFGNTSPPAPVLGSGVQIQRQLGVYAATQDTDVANTTTNNLSVAEAVITTQSLVDAGMGDVTGLEIASIDFRNPISNANYPNSTPATGSGFAILAATIRDAATAAPPNCPGDVDGDQDIDLTDLAILLTNFGRPSGATREMGDLDDDGDVDLTDLAILLSRFGTSC